MQPYFFPYIGYFQLMAASDLFVLHDDVQYIKGGWVNRNRILLNGSSRMLTFPVRKDSSEQPINSRSYVEDKQTRTRLANLVREAYSKAPRYREIFPLIEELLHFDDANVARFNEHAIRTIADHLGLSCDIVVSSDMDKDNHLAGEARVLEICRKLEAKIYINPIGGVGLYHHQVFRQNSIDLFFLRATEQRYPQLNQPWTPFLSIIDVLMFNSPDAVHALLGQYQLLTHAEADTTS